MIRRTVFYSGRVQGVGFRYTACHVAGGYEVTGYVRNLDDGGVELVAEGEEGELAGFLAALEERMRGHIRQKHETDSDATGRYKGFSIQH